MKTPLPIYWRNTPAMHFVIPIVFGILLSTYLSCSLTLLLFILSSVLCCWFLLELLMKTKAIQFRGLFVIVIVALTMMLHSTNYRFSTNQDFYTPIYSLLEMRICKPPIEKTKTFQYEVELLSGQKDGITIPVKGKAIVYIDKKIASNLVYGDHFFTNQKLKKAAGPMNPGDFNYKQFLAQQNIDFQNYLPENKIFFSTVNTRNKLITWLNHVKQKLIQVLQETLVNEDSKAITAALLLGHKSWLNGEIEELYSDTGAMHILAVSGLHVGILYFVLLLLLKPFHGIRYSNTIQFIIIIGCIWTYALLTGLSPSVTRASLMFSLFGASIFFNRSSHSINIVFASAIILLIYNPLLLFRVSFQLSYAAVLSIIFFQPRIADAFYIKNVILKNCWDITAVSIAAQIGTLPIAMYYFGKIPILFFIPNIAVIYGATLIFWFGILLFFFQKIAIVSDILAWLIDSSIQILNAILKFVQAIPFSTLENININVLTIVLIYLAIIFLVQYIATKVNHRILVSLSFMLVSIIIFQSFLWNNEAKEECIIYHNNKFDKISEFTLGQERILYESKPESDTDSTKLNQKIFYKNNIIHINAKKFYPLTNDSIHQIYYFSEGKLPENLNDSEEVDAIVFAAQLKYWKRDKMKEKLVACGYDYYDIAENGAYLIH